MKKLLLLKPAALVLCGVLAVSAAFAEPPANPNDLNFVRQGLVFTITGANIAADGTVQVRFKIADKMGAPLDRLGVTTPGKVSTSFILASIPAGATQYVSYLTRVAGPSPISGRSATQATSENTGTFTQVAEGEYIYTFSYKVPAGFDPNATHTVAMNGSRDLNEFDLGVQFDDAVFSWVPNGSPVTTVRDVVRTGSCNKCHYDLGMHGGSRKSVELCVLCHTPQTTDPDTGNTVNLPVMIHKIHMGSSLPSVKAGTPYTIVGYAQTVFDFSDVVFPADVRNCTACHEQSGPNKAAQSDRMFNANAAACGACHDNVDFRTGKNHLGLPQFDNNLCTTCHIKQGEEWFDKSIVGAHAIDNTVASLIAGVNVKIDRIIDGTAGKTPTVQMIITDNQGQAVAPSALSRLTVRLNGPTSDYANAISESATAAGGNSSGYAWWTFATPIPADATGSWSVSTEARRDVVLRGGAATQATARASAKNAIVPFSVDGSPVKARRQVVATEKCNACHFNLSAHGGVRNDTQLCSQCHSASLVYGTGAAAISLDFPVLVHRIHTGENLTRPYAVGTHNFNEVAYPGDRRVCSQCHVNGSENLPLQAGLRPVSDPGGPIKSLSVTAAACTGCHDTLAAASHVLANTTALGDSCEVCHGSDAEFSVARVHKR